jgi:hypothetical protein
MMKVAVLPVFHEKVVPPLAVRVTAEPEQTVFPVEVIVGLGIGVTSTLEVEVAVHPFASVIIARYEVLAEGVTTTVEEVELIGFQK